MSQSDYILSNVSASTARTKINEMVQAGASLNAGASAPSTTYAYMMWHDTTNDLLKQRNGADNLWINVAYVDQSGSLYSVLDGTEVVTTGGTKVGELTTQTESTWETGTSTEDTLVSPAKVKAAIESLANAIGVGQTFQDVTAQRAAGTSYQNSTGRTITVMIAGHLNSVDRFLRVSTNGSDWLKVGHLDYNGGGGTTTYPIPDGYYYRLDLGTTITLWTELR